MQKNQFTHLNFWFEGSRVFGLVASRKQEKISVVKKAAAIAVGQKNKKWGEYIVAIVIEKGYETLISKKSHQLTILCLSTNGAEVIS